MKIINNNNFSNNNLIDLKDDKWLMLQRQAGKIAAKTLLLLKKIIEEGNPISVIELDKISEEFIIKNNGIPTFKNYKGYPNSCCISVGKQLVHAIATDYILQPYDMVSIDLGVTVEGAIADTALTTCFKDSRPEQLRLINATKESLIKGIEAVKVGKKIGNIGYAISRYAKEKNYGLIEQYGGHGLTWNKPHAQPFVANKSTKDEGVRIQPGLTIAIEPQLTSGSIKTWIDKDGWTVWCEADMSSHEEHTVFVHEDHVEIITDRNI